MHACLMRATEFFNAKILIRGEKDNFEKKKKIQSRR